VLHPSELGEIGRDPRVGAINVPWQSVDDLEEAAQRHARAHATSALSCLMASDPLSSSASEYRLRARGRSGRGAKSRANSALRSSQIRRPQFGV
jgi:hypothetical protein